MARGDFGRNKKSKLEDLSQRIYSRIKPPKQRKRRALYKEYVSDTQTELPDEVLGIKKGESKQDESENKKAPLSDFYDDILQKETKESHNGPKLFLAFATLFFFVSVVATYFFVVAGLNEVSTRNISLFVKGLNYVESGQLLQLQIYVENKNRADLESAYVIIDYPPGTLIPDQKYAVSTYKIDRGDIRSVRQRISLGKIKSGELRKGTARARIFGEKDQAFNLHVSFEYRVRGSSAIYAVEKDYPIKISSDALALSVDGPSEAVYGQNPHLKVKLKNNSKSAMSFVLLEAKVPLGVKIISSTPKGQQDGKWFFPTLLAGEEKDIDITLEVDGQSGDERVIKFDAGVKDVNSEKLVADLIFKEEQHKLKVSRPFLATFVNVGKEMDSGYSVIKSGTKVDGNIAWTNTLPHRIEDLFLVVSLTGNALDKYAVSARKGFYKSGENLLIWDKTTLGKKFESVTPAKSGTLEFTIGALPKDELVKVRDPKIIMEVNASAKRLSESGVVDNLKAVSKKEIRVETDLDFTARSLYFENPLQSGGPLPPKADKVTVYGVEWTVNNSSNLAKDVVVTAYLPPNVEWAGASMPAIEDIKYNPTNGRITWNLGTVKPGSGYYLPSRRVFFNINLTPSITQVGGFATLLLDQKIKAIDTFTNTKIEYGIKKLDTRLQEAQANEYYYKVGK